MFQILKAYAFIAGGMIGVGLFGLPYVLIHAGLIPTIIFGVVVCAIAYIINLSFADLVLRTGGRPRRLPGYIGERLGKIPRSISLGTQVLGLGGALLAYLVTSGIFLSFLFREILPVSEGVATLITFAVLSPLFLRFMTRVLWVAQMVIVLMFFIVLIALLFVAAPEFSFSEIPVITGGPAMLMPYGVLLFSFWSLALVPETTEILKKDWKKICIVFALTYGTAAISYVSFAILIAGVTGSETTPDGLTGLGLYFTDGVLTFGAIFALLTTASSYLALGLTLKRVFTMEFHLSPFIAWVVTVIPPLVLYFIGLKQFLIVVSVTGAVFLGIEGALALLAYLYSDPKRSSRVRWLCSPALIIVVITLCMSGVALEILRIIRGD